VLLAAISLLAQALLPPPTGATAAPIAREVPDWVMASLCLSHEEAARASDDRPAMPAPTPNPGQRSSDCAFCLGLHLVGAFVPPPPAALLPPAAAHTIRLAAWTSADRGDAYRTASRARAPPATS
jgi:hypothetical protein